MHAMQNKKLSYAILLLIFFYIILIGVKLLAFDKGIFLFELTIFLLTVVTSISKRYLYPATAAILVLGISDSFAAIAGRIDQIIRKKEFKKSITGACVFALLTIIILYNIKGLVSDKISIMYIILFSIFLSIGELAFFKDYDNICIPVFVFVFLCMYI